VTAEQLNFYSSWASLFGLAVSVISLLYVRSIKTNIVRFRRKLRIRQLIEDISRIPDDATPLSSASQTKLSALKRNIPVFAWSPFTARGRLAIEVHRHVESQDILALKEAIQDLSSYSEDL
jgi:hypothetical protein